MTIMSFLRKWSTVAAVWFAVFGTIPALKRRSQNQQSQQGEMDLMEQGVEQGLQQDVIISEETEVDGEVGCE